jgi:hypothetical protein
MVAVASVLVATLYVPIFISTPAKAAPDYPAYLSYGSPNVAPAHPVAPAVKPSMNSSPTSKATTTTKSVTTSKSTTTAKGTTTSKATTTSKVITTSKAKPAGKAKLATASPQGTKKVARKPVKDVDRKLDRDRDRDRDVDRDATRGRAKDFDRDAVLDQDRDFALDRNEASEVAAMPAQAVDRDIAAKVQQYHEMTPGITSSSSTSTGSFMGDAIGVLFSRLTDQPAVSLNNAADNGVLHWRWFTRHAFDRHDRYYRYDRRERGENEEYGQYGDGDADD